MIDSLLSTSRLVAIITFLIGTIIFLAQLFIFNSGNLFGFVYLIVATCINLIFAIALVGYIFTCSESRPELMKTLGIVILNIPIAVSYFKIVIEYY